MLKCKTTHCAQSAPSPVSEFTAPATPTSTAVDVGSLPTPEAVDEKKSTDNLIQGRNTPIPTVWIESENSEEDSENTENSQNYCLYAPTCVSDFNLAWVQFVMQQYFETNFSSDGKNVKSPEVRSFTVAMAGTGPDSNEKASKG